MRTCIEHLRAGICPLAGTYKGTGVQCTEFSCAHTSKEESALVPSSLIPQQLLPPKSPSPQGKLYIARQNGPDSAVAATGEHFLGESPRRATLAMLHASAAARQNAVATLQEIETHSGHAAA